MKNGFDKDGFMSWLKEEFPGCLDTHWNWDLVENIIDHALKSENVGKDQFCYFLSDLVPEVEMLEVAKFCKDEKLTKDTLKALGRFI